MPMDGVKCFTCEYWATYARHVHTQDWGQCRRHAPTGHPYYNEDEELDAPFPKTHETHWCGEWVAR